MRPILSHSPTAMHRLVVLVLVLALFAFLLPWGEVSPDAAFGSTAAHVSFDDELRVLLGSLNSSVTILWLGFPNWLACMALVCAALVVHLHQREGRDTIPIARILAAYAGAHTLYHLGSVWWSGGRWGLAHLAMVGGALVIFRLTHPDGATAFAEPPRET
jgi:hypothetical protein